MTRDAALVSWSDQILPWEFEEETLRRGAVGIWSSNKDVMRYKCPRAVHAKQIMKK